MLGYPLKLVLNAVERRHGREGVIRVLEAAGLPPDQTYRLNECYDDGEAQRLSAAAFKEVVLADVAQAFFDDTLVRFPNFSRCAKTLDSFWRCNPKSTTPLPLDCRSRPNAKPFVKSLD
jgi:hypothetical protein